jgi:hypothetical protein
MRGSDRWSGRGRERGIREIWVKYAMPTNNETVPKTPINQRRQQTCRRQSPCTTIDIVRDPIGDFKQLQRMRASRHKTKQKPNQTKQNKTKQNKTKQNKTKQNKTTTARTDELARVWSVECKQRTYTMYSFRHKEDPCRTETQPLSSVHTNI